MVALNKNCPIIHIYTDYGFINGTSALVEFLEGIAKVHLRKLSVWQASSGPVIFVFEYP